jgi:three-Cys-motif partner protein
VRPPFDSYTFIERDASKAAALEARLLGYPEHRTAVAVGDANERLASFVEKTNWRQTRAVAFLDPFGNQVSWSTLELLAQTRAIDVWYLFPSGLGVLRQIGRSGHVHPHHQASLDRLFGTPEWRDRLVGRAPVQDLFGDADEALTYRASAEQITAYMIERMNGIFSGGVHPTTLALGSRNIHMYSLIFACANPSKRACELAHRLAGAVLSSGKRKGIVR